MFATAAHACSYAPRGFDCGDYQDDGSGIGFFGVLVVIAIIAIMSQR